MIRVVRYVSECDVVNVTELMEREAALEVLRTCFATLKGDFDLVDARGRFVSWVL